MPPLVTFASASRSETCSSIAELDFGRGSMLQAGPVQRASHRAGI